MVIKAYDEFSVYCHQPSSPRYLQRIFRSILMVISILIFINTVNVFQHAFPFQYIIPASTNSNRRLRRIIAFPWKISGLVIGILKTLGRAIHSNSTVEREKISVREKEKQCYQVK